jgi:SAM-dependent methyltransferase
MTGPLHADRQRACSFGTDADRYDRARPSYPPALLDDLLASRPVKVLDVGCGTGIAARLLQARGCEVLGIEPDERMAAVARRRGLRVEPGRFEDWRPPSGTVDLIVSGQAWHWVDPVAGAPGGAGTAARRADRPVLERRPDRRRHPSNARRGLRPARPGTRRAFHRPGQPGRATLHRCRQRAAGDRRLPRAGDPFVSLARGLQRARVAGPAADPQRPRQPGTAAPRTAAGRPGQGARRPHRAGRLPHLAGHCHADGRGTAR